LLEACRLLSGLSNHPVGLEALLPKIHAYLRRIDFFERSAGAAYPLDEFDITQELGRGPSSPSVLELSSVEDRDGIYRITQKARTILAYWLGITSDDTDLIISLLSESCSNVLYHSQGSGTVAIQKYVHNNYGENFVEIQLAISDKGVGIKESLRARHGSLSDTCSGYINLALDGWTDRLPSPEGQGLATMERIATKSGGSLYIRSGTGSVFSRANGRVAQDDLTFFPGTQIGITFRKQLS
jgi:hypothetical protein